MTSPPAGTTKWHQQSHGRLHTHALGGHFKERAAQPQLHTTQRAAATSDSEQAGVTPTAAGRSAARAHIQRQPGPWRTGVPVCPVSRRRVRAGPPRLPSIPRRPPGAPRTHAGQATGRVWPACASRPSRALQAMVACRTRWALTSRRLPRRRRALPRVRVCFTCRVTGAGLTRPAGSATRTAGRPVVQPTSPSKPPVLPSCCGGPFRRGPAALAWPGPGRPRPLHAPHHMVAAAQPASGDACTDPGSVHARH